MAEEQKLRLELTPEAMDGVYTNFSVITHTTGEFIIDFARVVPGKTVAKVYSRIIMSPINFKLFKQAVDENLSNYEKKHGNINYEMTKNQITEKTFESLSLHPIPLKEEKKKEEKVKENKNNKQEPINDTDDFDGIIVEE
jgi:hypothetical protein